MTAELTAGTAELSAVTDLGLGFATAKVVLTALELDVFTVLADGPRTEPELRRLLGLHGRGSRDFLGALVALGLLEIEGGSYRNSALAAHTLVRGPGYAGGFLEGANFALYPAWGGLGDALRTGAPQNVGDFEAMLHDPVGQRRYLAMMDSLSAPLAPAISAALPWGRYRDVADVGGARGNLLSLLLREHGELTGVVFDRPQNAAACAEHTAERGVADRVTFIGGDFFTDPLPTADVVIIGHVLADFSLEQRRGLVAAAHRAIRPGGALVLYDPMPDPWHPTVPSVVASLHMLVMSPAGAGYPVHECVQWLTDAGFVGATVLPLPLGNTLVIGQKRR